MNWSGSALATAGLAASLLGAGQALAQESGLVGGLSALGRLGVYRARTVETQELSAFPQFNSQDAGTNSGWTYGAGLAYDLGPLGVRAEWQRYENVGVSTTGEHEVDVFSIGVLFRF